MHELSIASAIVEAVSDEIRKRNLQAVHTITVRVGALSGVVPDALQFGYEAIVAGTPLANTKLEIESVPVQGKCKACGHEFAVEEFLFACPLCHGGDITITRGEELEIVHLEVAT